MLNKAWPLLLCKLNKHDWLIELRGHAYQGSVYPIRFRTCKHCQCIEQEVFDDASQTAHWRRMNNKLNIGIASPEDIPALCRLLEALFTQEAEFKPNLENQQRGLLKIIENPLVGFILIAKLDDVAVGMVNILFTISTALGERVALLEDMVVAETYRNRGYGNTIIEYAIAEARRQRCKRITLLTDNTNESAQRFYEQYGFIRSNMVPFRLSLN